MRFTAVLRQGMVIGAAFALAACSSGGGDSGSGASTLSISLADAPVDGVASVKVKIDAIWLKGENGPAQKLPLAATPASLDLLALTPDSAALLIDAAPVEPGKYEWLAMDVSADFDGVYDSYVLTTAGGQEEVRVPSGRVRLVDGFEIGPNQAVKLMFDWDLRKGLVHPPGQPGYFLKPAFRMLDVHELGALKGVVAPETLTAVGDPNGCAADSADLALGNVVYVFAGANVAPDDIDGVTPEPVATGKVAPNALGQNAYRVVLAPGDYTVAFTCQAGNDDPEVNETGTATELKFLPAVNRTVAADVETIADF